MKISSDQIKQSIKSQTNESPGDDGLTAEFYKLFSNELAPLPLDVLTPGENLTRWMLLLG